MMNRKIMDITVWIVFIAFIGLTFLMPETIPTHFDINGNVDGYGSRYTFLIFAFLIIGTYYGMLLDKKIDPRKRRKANRSQIFDTFRYGLTFFFILMGGYFACMIYYPDMMKKVSIAFIIGIMFIGIGNYLPRVPQNYTLGIKTPWTLDNEIVWIKTHRFGGYGFVVGGILTIISAFMGNVISFIVLMVTAIGVSLLCLVYSYYLYKQEEKKNDKY